MSVQQSVEHFKQATQEALIESRAQREFHREELVRVMQTFGPRKAMEFAWEHFEIPALAFCAEFELSVEKMGVWSF